MPALVSSRGGSTAFVYQVVAVGSSAGGLSSLGDLIDKLPAEFRCPILVVQHLSPEYKSIFAEILGRRSAVHVEQAIDRQPMLPGVVYVGAPALHLIAENGLIRLRSTPPVNHQRPSINMMFDSVAASYGEGAIGVILSGSGTDGAEGVASMKAAGGYIISEDPDTAKFASMPKAAIATGCVDKIMASGDIGELILELSQLRRSVDQIIHE